MPRGLILLTAAAFGYAWIVADILIARPCSVKSKASTCSSCVYEQVTGADDIGRTMANHFHTVSRPVAEAADRVRFASV